MSRCWCRNDNPYSRYRGSNVVKPKVEVVKSRRRRDLVHSSRGGGCFLKKRNQDGRARRLNRKVERERNANTKCELNEMLDMLNMLN